MPRAGDGRRVEESGLQLPLPPFHPLHNACLVVVVVRFITCRFSPSPRRKYAAANDDWFGVSLVLLLLLCDVLCRSLEAKRSDLRLRLLQELAWLPSCCCCYL